MMMFHSSLVIFFSLPRYINTGIIHIWLGKTYQCLETLSGWWFSWNMTWRCFHVLLIIIPLDELIFFRRVGIPPTRYGEASPFSWWNCHLCFMNSWWKIFFPFAHVAGWEIPGNPTKMELFSHGKSSISDGNIWLFLAKDAENIGWTPLRLELKTIPITCNGTGAGTNQMDPYVFSMLWTTAVFLSPKMITVSHASHSTWLASGNLLLKNAIYSWFSHNNHSKWWLFTVFCMFTRG